MQPDVAIDFGTSRIRILTKNKQLVTDEPSVMMVKTEDGSVAAVGHHAYCMLGRNSPAYTVSYPLRAGVIADFGMAEAMLRIFLKRAAVKGIGIPRAVVSVPSSITETQKNTVVEAVAGAGIRKICLMEEPVAAAMGAGMEIDSPHGSLVVNIGGGTTDMAVISLGGTAVSRTLPYAGDTMDESVIRYIRKTYNMLIGKRTAEQAKIRAGSVVKGMIPGTYAVKGKCLLTGMPIQAEMDAEELVAPLTGTVKRIIEGIRDLLLATPPELISDIDTDGILLTGGGACLKGIAPMIQKAVDLKVTVADDPANCVIRGCGMAMDYIRRPNGVDPILARY